MNRFILPLGAFLLLAIVLAVGIRHSTENGVIKSPLIGKPAPQFSLPDLQDPARTLKSSDLKGRWYVLNAWGAWCYVCRIEHPALLEYHKQDVVPIIGMDFNDHDEDALQFLTQLGNPYTQVIADRDGRTAIDFGVYGAPETFLVNPEGIVVFKHVGALTPEVWRREFLPRLPQKAAKS